MARWSGGQSSLLRSNATSDAVVLYASMPCAWIVSVMALDTALEPLDRDALQQASVGLDDTWVIQRSYGGGESHRVYLEPPLACSSENLKGGELPVYRRTFHGMGRVEPFEINQKLLHALGLFHIAHRSAYCRLDANGDLEDVITLHSDPGTGPHDRLEMVTIRSKDLADYLALSRTTLVRRFDFTRVDHQTFSGWREPNRAMRGTTDLYYSWGSGGGNGSWVNGYQLLRSCLTPELLAAAFEAEDDARRNREYETFIAYDWKNKKVVTTSCGPEGTANYFTQSDLPFELSPAFFRPEVLAKYKADMEKYRLEDRSISCRNAWHLKTYDINEAGQVHTYLCYLADLPIGEQRYWKSFNEEPKAGISKRAFDTDFQGEWSSEYDPLGAIKEAVGRLDMTKPSWWTPRGEALLNGVRYPATDAAKEWADEILALDQLLVEGFLERGLKRLTEEAGGELATHSGGLNALVAALKARGLLEEAAIKAVAPLKTLHHLRSKVKGHAAPREAEVLRHAALTTHGTFRAHFTALAADCDAGLDAILLALGISNEAPFA